MAVSQSQKLALQKYKDNNYDRLAILIKKGKREEYKQAAERLGLGYAEMIRLAIDAFIAENAGEEFKTTTPAPMTAEERKLIDDFNALPDDVRKSISKLIRQINQIQPQNQAP